MSIKTMQPMPSLIICPSHLPFASALRICPSHLPFAPAPRICPLHLPLASALPSVLWYPVSQAQLQQELACVAQAQDQGDVSDSAYSSQPQSSQPSQNRPDAEDPQWQRQGEGQRGQKEEQSGEGETDQGDDSPLEQSLHVQRSSHCPDAHQPNDRVMNILKVILTSTLVNLNGIKV